MEKPYSPQDDYDDDNIPEIDLPKESDSVPVIEPVRMSDFIPDEVPRRDGPGGE